MFPARMSAGMPVCRRAVVAMLAGVMPLASLSGAAVAQTAEPAIAPAQLVPAQFAPAPAVAPVAAPAAASAPVASPAAVAAVPPVTAPAAPPAPAAKLAVPVPALDMIFEAEITLAARVDIGQTPLGQRRYIPITGGTVNGPAFTGRVVPGGGDWQLALADGCSSLSADYFLQAQDGTIIKVANTAGLCPDASGAMGPIYTTPRFEAPEGTWRWLNAGAYVARLVGGTDPSHPSVHIWFYRLR